MLLRGSEPEGLGRAEQVSYQLETAIMMGILGEGDRLPRELVLASELGVSPATLRESLSALRSKGLIETSRGRGGGSVVLGQLEPSGAEVRRRLRTTNTEELRDLGDHCTAIAAISAKLAAERADDRNVQYLAGLAERFENSSSPQERRRADSRFHVTVGVAAQSSRLTAAMLQIQAELSGFIWAADEYGFSVAEASRQHAQIVEGIAKHDPAAAAEAAESHSRSETALLIAQHLQLLVQSEESG
ncbi:GntR family transcriptional regulator [Arthrobacter ginkgonis]|uniref:GntR family transcriptional regulator n=1 Tax=Arthrobacter ginkgonis TaxID=1630594 RepID=A0ABP7DGI4_9MICC